VVEVVVVVLLVVVVILLVVGLCLLVFLFNFLLQKEPFTFHPIFDLTDLK
jgi:hypothetical protein